MKSLLKAIDTINAVADAGSAEIRELSTITGYPPSTIHRIAATLVERHYFQQDPVTKQSAASISITGAAMRVTPDRIKLFGKLVSNCATAISRQLGFNPAN